MDTYEQRLASIEQKLDRLLGTLGIREAIGREERHKVRQLASMSLDDLTAYSRRIGRKK